MTATDAASSSMGCLNDLSNELLLEIFELICYAERPRLALASLSRTSRRFNHLAESLLYRSYCNEHNRDAPHLFPISLVNCAFLAHHVRSLDLHLERGLRELINPMPEEDFRQLKAAIEAFGFPFARTKEWTDSLARQGLPRVHACAALVVFLVSSHVHELTLSYQQGPPQLYQFDFDMRLNHLLFRLMRITLFEHETFDIFEKVHTVRIFRPDDKEVPIRLYPFAFVFKMPHLRYFEARGCLERDLGNDDHGRRWRVECCKDWQLLQDDSPVETLVLYEVDIMPSALSVLLRRCKAVKHLHLELADFDVDDNVFTFNALLNALHYQRESLESFSLVLGNGYPMRRFCSTVTGYPSNGWLSLLTQFPKLKRARFPTNCLSTADELAIANTPSNEAQAKTVLPNLMETITICGDSVHYGDTKNFPWQTRGPLQDTRCLGHVHHTARSRFA